MLPKKSTRVRQEEIVRAALEVMGKSGVRALTIAAIAKTAGMSEANIYRHFGGKDDILFALCDFMEMSFVGRAATIAAGSRSPLEKMKTIIFSHIEMIAENPGIPRFMFSEDIHLRNRKLAETLAFRLGSYAETLSGIIAAGIAEGELRQGLSPRETALTLIGMIQFTSLRWSISGAAFEFREETHKLWNNFVKFVT